MRKLICILLLLAMCLCSCGTDTSGDKSSTASQKASSVASKTESKVESKEPVIPAVNDYSKRTYKVMDIMDYLKLDGRYRTRTDYKGQTTGITMDNAYNCISFVADCEGDITIDLELKIHKADTEGWLDRYFTVYIDGVRQEGRASVTGVGLVEKDCTLTVATDLSKGKHTIEVYRQNEASAGKMLLKAITMNGVPAEKPADRDLLIEFVGDSITAGYGSLVMGSVENPGHAKNSDATSTYAFLTAKALNADITAICRSGHCFAGEEPLFADFYSETEWLYDRGNKYTATRHPDIVVINLGTNDANHSDASTLADYAKKAVEVVKAAHPDAKIVWAYGLMGDQITAQIKQGLEAAGGEAKGIYFCPLSTDYSGGGGHPSLAGHKNGADLLIKYIKDKGLV